MSRRGAGHCEDTVWFVQETMGSVLTESTVAVVDGTNLALRRALSTLGLSLDLRPLSVWDSLILVFYRLRASLL